MNVQAFCNIPLPPVSVTDESGRIRYVEEATLGQVETIKQPIVLVVMEEIVLAAIWRGRDVLTIPRLDNVSGELPEWKAAWYYSLPFKM